MATTTNFGWETPDDTDLVKDGAAAIRTALGGVDTSFVDLKGGTTGQVLAKASATDLDYNWTTISSGGMTLLSTTTLSGATVTISSISQSYKSLFMVISGATNATGNGAGAIKPNAANNATYLSIESTSAGTTQSTANVNQPIQLNLVQTKLRTDANNAWSLQIDNYASTTTYKPFLLNGQYLNSSSFNAAIIQTGAIQTNTAITSLEFSWSNGNLLTGTVLLYGVN